MAAQGSDSVPARFTAYLSRPSIRNSALVLAATALLMLLWQSDEPLQPDPEATALRGSTEPDTFISDGVLRTFNAQGQRQLVVTSPRIEQFEARQEASIQQPIAVYFDTRADVQWHLSASQGWVDLTAEVMDLTGDVSLTREVAGGQAVLRSEHLRIDNPSGKINTSQPVVLESPGAITRADGLTGWLDQRILELETNVEGVYETRP